MFDIKKYIDGRFYDTINEKFINNNQLAELIKKGEQIKITLVNTGKDITDSVIAQFTEKKEQAEDFIQKTTEIKQWIGETVDKQINVIIKKLNFPTGEQIAKLEKTISILNTNLVKIEKNKEVKPKKATAKVAAKKAPAKKAPAKKASETKTTETKEAPAKKTKKEPVKKTTPKTAKTKK